MPIYTITLDDSLDVGVTAAIEAANAALPETRDGDAGDGYCADNTAYIQCVMTDAAESYCKQHGVGDEAIAELEAKLAAAKAMLKK